MSILRTGAQRQARELVGEAHRLMAALDCDEKPQGLVGLTPGEIERYSLLRVIGEMADMKRVGRPWRIEGVEGEAHRELVKKHGELASHLALYIPPEIQHRDLTANVASAGGYLVGAVTGGSYIEVLRNRSVAFRLGAQRLPGQRENLLIPRQSGAATAAWLSTEGSAATESQQTLQQVTGAPKTVGAYTEISRQLTKQSNPSAEALVMTDLASVIALALDTAVIAGTGATGQPTGLTLTPGIGTFSGTTLGLTALAEAQEDVLAANALLNPQTLGYATTPAVAKLLKGRQRFTGSDTPCWQGPLHDGEIEGVRSIASLQIPTAAMIFGDWSQILIPEWGVLAIEINPFAGFQAAIIGVRSFWTCDVVVRHAESFTLSSSIT
jgi:HK97 family phage major capsid protein